MSYKIFALNPGSTSTKMAMFEDDRILMELKLPGVCPLWLSQALSQISAFPTSFSKYGYCYTKTLLPGAIEKFQEVRHYA